MFGAAYTLLGYLRGQWQLHDKIIFLDIDGVLHSASGENGDFFVDRCCAHLQEIVDLTGASIVLSSMWRLEYRSLFQVNHVLFSLGLPPVIGCTDHLQGCRREEEISKWLDEHPEVRSWIAIDDWPLDIDSSAASRRMSEHFVRTTPSRGLKEQDVHLAVSLMAKQGGIGL
mmetsp:Transcript_19938/g.45984  ORF Transcript_19938/g.45984 Transcript_19938/m.45984 type:complete len:171 (-) Transcript_19938:59-571(-)